MQLTFDETVGFAALQAIVATGRGVSLMPELATRHLRHDLRARPLGAPVRRVSVAHREGAAPSALRAAMLEALKLAAATRGSGRGMGTSRLPPSVAVGSAMGVSMGNMRSMTTRAV